MDLYVEMQRVVEKFCNLTPPDGFETNYLENAEKISALYAEASTILENEEVDEERLKSIYGEMKKLAD